MLFFWRPGPVLRVLALWHTKDSEEGGSSLTLRCYAIRPSQRVRDPFSFVFAFSYFVFHFLDRSASTWTQSTFSSALRVSLLVAGTGNAKSDHFSCCTLASRQCGWLAYRRRSCCITSPIKPLIKILQRMFVGMASSWRKFNWELNPTCTICRQRFAVCICFAKENGVLKLKDGSDVSSRNRMCIIFFINACVKGCYSSASWEGYRGHRSRKVSMQLWNGGYDDNGHQKAKNHDPIT